MRIYLFLLLAFFPVVGFAQETETALVADVSIDNILVVQNEPRMYIMAFTIANGLGVQPNVQYGLRVVDAADNRTVDGVFMEETLTLREGEGVERIIEYVAPETLNGDHLLILEARGLSGIPLAIANADLITVDGSGDVSETTVFPKVVSSLYENIILDKEVYESGETAQVLVSAVVPDVYDVSVRIEDRDGNVCGEATRVYTPTTLRTDMDVSITQDCTVSSAYLIFTDGSGTVVSEQTYTFFAQANAETPHIPYKSIFAVLILVLIAIFIYQQRSQKEKTQTLTLSSIALIFLASSFFAVVPHAEAATWRLGIGTKAGGGGGAYNCIVFAGWNRGNSTATPGQRLSTSIWKDSDCFSNVNFHVQIGSYGANSPTISTAGYGNGTMRFTAPSNPGQHTMYVSAGAWNQFGGARGQAAKQFTLTVQAPTPQPTVELQIRNVTQGGSWTRADGVRVLAQDASLIERVGAYVQNMLSPYAFAGGTVNATEGDTIGLRWESEDARLCTGTNVSTGGRTDGGDTDRPNPGTKTYSVRCNGDGGSASDSARAVVAALDPSASLSASPSTITEGGTTVLTWDSENADRCGSLTNPLKTNGATSGSQNITLANAQVKTFRIDCDGAIATTRVTVREESVPAPTVSIRARVKTPSTGPWHTSAFTIEPNEGIQINYSSTNATTCTSSDFNTFGEPNGWRGTISEPSPGQSKTYAVTCTGDGGSASDSIRVSTNESEPEEEPEDEPSSPSTPTPSVTLQVRNTTQGGSWTGSNITIDPEDQVSLRWSSSNATTCNGSNFSTGGADDGTQSSVSEPSAGSNKVYSVSCTGDGGSDSDSLRVTTQAIDPSLSADSTRVREGESVSISYNMQGNDPAQCSLTGPGVSYLAGSFSGQTGFVNVSISGDSTFTLACTGGSDEVSIELIPVVFDS
ncbi:hypothetical protein KTR10_01000 [Candidatus Kaiserbacteria bacterium]|nr:hypothetical protein [Candidatus Kaiserbacteria bacterium]